MIAKDDFIPPTWKGLKLVVRSMGRKQTHLGWARTFDEAEALVAADIAKQAVGFSRNVNVDGKTFISWQPKLNSQCGYFLIDVEDDDE